MMKIYIGPNGYGKTTQLNKDKSSLINSGVSEDEILFLESELLLSDEIKDTKDSTKTMEYIIAELLCTPAVQSAQAAYEAAVDNEITNNIANVNIIMDDILSLNGSTRTKDVIAVTREKEYKKLVAVSKKDFTDLMGSGQRMQFILSLVKNSSKQYIFLDEPEKYSHPSLLNRTAKIIRELNTLGKDIYIATHSAKLLSMLDFDISTELFLINDNSHTPKSIPILQTISELTSSGLPIGNFGNKEKELYNPSKSSAVIKTLYYKEFLGTLFSKKVYLCEGINDANFVKKFLIDNNSYYDDYYIFSVFGKYCLPFFVSIYKKLGINFCTLFDEDDPSISLHSWLNNYFTTNSPNYFSFRPRIEQHIGYTGIKTDIFGFWEYLDSLTLNAATYPNIL